MIKDAKPNKPFHVIEMKQNMFENYDVLQKLVVNKIKVLIIQDPVSVGRGICVLSYKKAR